MKSTRMVTVAALAFGAALALSGCATDASAPESTTAASATDACSEVRNVTNGALNTLAGDLAADPTAKSEYFETLSTRMEALVGTVDNKNADEAFTAFVGALTDASEYALTVTPPAEAADGAEEEATDPALVATMTEVQDAAAEAAANCSAE